MYSNSPSIIEYIVVVISIRCPFQDSFGDHLCPIARNYIDQRNEIHGVLPMNCQKRRRLIVEKQILAQQRPQRDGLGRGRLLRIAGIVAKRLNITRHFPFDRQRAFEGTPRRHPAVLIDGVDTFTHAKWRRSGRPGAEVIVSNGEGTVEPLEARLIFAPLRRQAKSPIRKRVSESEAAGRRTREVLNAHPNFTFRREKPKEWLAVLFGLSRLWGKAKP